MDPRDVANRDLLIGLLALQNGLVDQAVLVAAFHAWTRDKSRPIAEVLAAQGAIDAGERALLEGLAEKHLKRHGGDAEKSLAALNTGRAARESLAKIGDPDIEATLDRVKTGFSSNPTVPEGDSDVTMTVGVGSVTSDGQRFRVVRPHARGGLGAVFVALDGELNREVALKQILDHHADDPNSRTRFVLEAEITGGLEHPGIVPVYGLGKYGDGRPYYAMRFVSGDSLKDTIEAFHADLACKNDPGRRTLELRKLLRRFIDVCHAIEYAHSRGVLHRDIKPANIIVGKYGETLVIDWGLAKPIGRGEAGGEMGERTLMPSSASGSSETLPGSAMGTPAYMSPEQATGDIRHLGPRSDVYSLGATLYCLLTGKPAFQGDDVGAVLRAVQKGDFPPPRKLDPTIPRALEAVCQKAMATRPEDRYASARALVDDLERWMADEPVSARPEPFTERARRWIRHNRTKVTTAAMALMVTIVGLAVVLTIQARANRELQAALDRETEATKREMAAKNQANARFQIAQEAVAAFYTGASEDVMLRQPQMQELRKKLLQTALKFYLQWQDEAGNDPRNSYIIISSGERVAEIQALIGLQEDAVKSYQRLLEHPEVRKQGAQRQGKLLLKLARVQRQLGRPTEAMRSYQQSLALFETGDERGVMQRGDLGWCLMNLGSFQDEIGRPDEALQTLERARVVNAEALKKAPNQKWIAQTLAATYTCIGNIQCESGNYVESLRGYEQAHEILARIVAELPANPEYRLDLARAYNNLGYQFTEAGRTDEALAMLERGRKIREEMYAAQPVNASFRTDLARSYFYRARLHVRTGQAAEALKDLRRTEELYEGVPVIVPEDLYYRACLPALHLKLLGPEEDSPKDGKKDERRQYAERAMDALRRALDGGFRKLRLIQHDPDLDALRSRPDFQGLLTDLSHKVDSSSKGVDASR